MKTLRLIVIGISLLLTARAAGPKNDSPELRGMLATGKSRVFALAQPGDGQTAWLSVGQSFAGWKLAEYRASEDALVLNRDGRELVLKLSTSTVGVVDPAKATLADAEAVLTKMKFEEMLGKMLEQQKQSVVAMSKQMFAGQKGIDSADLAAHQAKVMDLIWAEMNPESMRADFAKAYSEVFTKAELQAQADFYGTPGGAALIDKQPELSQKIMMVMTPRMAAAMPKVQQLSVEFAQEQGAKKKAAAAAAAASSPAP